MNLQLHRLKDVCESKSIFFTIPTLSNNVSNWMKIRKMLNVFEKKNLNLEIKKWPLKSKDLFTLKKKKSCNFHSLVHGF